MRAPHIRTALLCANPLRAVILEGLLESALKTSDIVLGQSLTDFSDTMDKSLSESMNESIDSKKKQMWVVLLDDERLNSADFDKLLALQQNGLKLTIIQITPKTSHCTDVWQAMALGIRTLPAHWSFITMRDEIRKCVHAQIKKRDETLR